MDGLVTWLQAQVAEDEHYASYVVNNGYANSNATWFEPSSGMVDTGDGQFSACADSAISRHIIRWDPARVLAECEAKRRLMERGGPFCDCYEGNPPMDPSTNWTVPIPHHYDCSAYEAAKVLATPYDERPGYREEWRP